jgi:class 3 adenylate cyclase
MEAAGPARVERRLAAIVAADVAGYSRLIGADEEGTLSRLKALRAEVIDPKIAEHHGRIVKTTGDGLLVEFASVVDALRCAAETQAAMAESNTLLPADKRIELRIGINMGDIVVEDGDIFGDGVNVAARLEGLAEPGGICVSARVREDAVGKLELAFRDMASGSSRTSRGRCAPTQLAQQRRPRDMAVVGSPQAGLLPRQSSLPLPGSGPRRGGFGLD